MDEVLKNANIFSEGENLYEILFVVLSPTIILINGISVTLINFNVSLCRFIFSRIFK